MKTTIALLLACLILAGCGEKKEPVTLQTLATAAGTSAQKKSAAAPAPNATAAKEPLTLPSPSAAGCAPAQKEPAIAPAPIVAAANEFRGNVVAVPDGDTIHVMHSGSDEKVRLEGIDCPESTQAFGDKAKDFTSAMVMGKEVTINTFGKDKYGRTLGEVLTDDGKSLNRELVKAGFAWWYRKYSTDATLGALEEEAKNGKLGLWADANPMAPWDYRHGAGDSPVEVGGSVPGTHSIEPPKAQAVDDAPGKNIEVIVHATKTGKKYHAAHCRYLNKSDIPMSLEQAKANGLTPCSACNPPK